MQRIMATVPGDIIHPGVSFSLIAFGLLVLGQQVAS